MNENKPEKVVVSTPLYKSDYLDIHLSDILPMAEFPKHIHYAEEQFIFCLEGESYHIINGKESHIKKGESVRIPAGSWHSSSNPSSSRHEKELVISHPIKVLKHPEIKVSENYTLTEAEFVNTVLYCMREYYDDLVVPFCVIGKEGNVLYSSRYFGSFGEECKKCISANHPDCIADSIKFINTQNMDGISMKCPRNVSIYHKNIVLSGKILGGICGQCLAFQSDENDDSGVKMYDNNRRAFEEMISQIAENLEYFCRFEAGKDRVLTTQDKIFDADEMMKKLSNELKISKDTILKLSINNHFLFNALNSIAAEAMENNDTGVYRSILALSEIIRRSNSSDTGLITIAEELKIIEKYISIQKLRYKDKLLFTIDCNDSMLLNIKIPVNSIHTVVENAFTHGFGKEACALSVTLTIRKSADSIIISCVNDGDCPSELEIDRVNRGIPHNNGHGLSMVYAALNRHYPGSRVEFWADENTVCTEIIIPVKEI